MTALPFNTTREVISFLSLAEANDYGLREEQQCATSGLREQQEAKDEDASAPSTSTAPSDHNAKKTYERIDVFNRSRNAQLVNAIQERQVECDQLRDANEALNETIETMQGRLRSLEVDFAQFKEHASVIESALQSEVVHLSLAAEENAHRALLIQVFADTAAHRDTAAEARQAALRPDIRLDTITSGVPANDTPREDDPIQRFVTKVYITLFSEPHGYDSLPRLLRDLREDSGLEGETLAKDLGYESFETFLHSPEMAPRILIGALSDERRRYKVYPTKAELERYVTQQLGTDYGDTRRALVRQREDNNKLRKQLASTIERVEKLKAEAPKLKHVLDANIELRQRIDELEKLVHCTICMDRPKDTAFACGHTYCNKCAVELTRCTLGCKKQNGKPFTFKYRIFL